MKLNKKSDLRSVMRSKPSTGPINRGVLTDCLRTIIQGIGEAVSGRLMIAFVPNSSSQLLIQIINFDLGKLRPELFGLNLSQIGAVELLAEKALMRAITSFTPQEAQTEIDFEESSSSLAISSERGIYFLAAASLSKKPIRTWYVVYATAKILGLLQPDDEFSYNLEKLHQIEEKKFFHHVRGLEKFLNHLPVAQKPGH